MKVKALQFGQPVLHVCIYTITQLDYKDIEVGGKQTEIEDLKQKNRQLQMDMSSLRSKPVGLRVNLQNNLCVCVCVCVYVCVCVHFSAVVRCYIVF